MFLKTVLVAFSVYHWGIILAQQQQQQQSASSSMTAQSTNGRPIFVSGMAAAGTGGQTFSQNSDMGNSNANQPMAASVSGSTGSGQDYQDTGDMSQFVPSPYAAQYQNTLQDILGNMQTANLRNPWNGGLIQPVPFYGAQNNGPSSMVPSQSFQIMSLQVFDAPATKAIAVLNTPANSTIHGMVVFTQVPGGGMSVIGNVTGLQPGSTHGFHVHQYGDLSNGCISAGAHFNPDNETHGGEDAAVRHVGDLGNIVADQNGIVMLNFTDNMIQLGGRNNIIGRAVVVHQNPDDLGLGNTADSLTTGNAGGRLACGVIGLVPAPVL